MDRLDVKENICWHMDRLDVKYACMRFLGAKYMETFGCMSLPFGCMSMDRLGACMRLLGASMRRRLGACICLLGASLMRLIAYLIVGCLPDSR